MIKNAIDSKAAGKRNEMLVLDLLRSSDSLSQSQICEMTGLGSSTISYIVGRLRDNQLIIEGPGQSSKRGAKPTVISINPDGQFIIGVEIGPSYISMGLFDFNAVLVDYISLPLKTDHSVENVIQLIEINLKGLLSKNKIPANKLIEVGIILSGSISKEGVVGISSSLGWKKVPLKQLLSSKFDCPVNIYSTKVRLLAEINTEPALSSSNIFYLNVGNGVGSTIIVDGKLIHGATSRCGELGHIVIDSAGPSCGCGQTGCLEAHISGPAIAKKLRDDIASGKQTSLNNEIKKQDIPEDVITKWVRAVKQNDAYACEIQKFIADKLSIATAIAINLYDPDVIILAGYINDTNTNYFAQAIKNNFMTNVYDDSSRDIKIIPAKVKDKTAIRGVAVAILQKQVIS
jgi:predicted NBD/HSP70 family sugar kinase